MAVTLALGLGSDLLRAWPVLVCAAIAVAGFGAALWCNQRSARMSEVVEITPHCVRVSRVGPAAKQFEATFHPTWVRVNVETDRIVTNRIVLRESGRSLSIGSFLTSDERLELAESLRSSLRAAGG